MKIENGVVLYELKGNWVKYEDIPELRIRADKEAGQIGTMLATLSNTTSKQGLTAEQLEDYARQLRTMLNDRDVLLSLAQDKFGNVDYRDEEGTPITNAEELYAQDAGALKEKMVAHYMGLIENAAKTGQRRNRRGGGSGGSNRYILTTDKQQTLDYIVKELDGWETKPDTNEPLLSQTFRLKGGTRKWELKNIGNNLVAVDPVTGQSITYANIEEFKEDYTIQNRTKL
jgi:hypothetical protein